MKKLKGIETPLSSTLCAITAKIYVKNLVNKYLCQNRM